MADRVAHFEIPSNDPARSMRFFETIFGWHFQEFGKDGYWLAISGDESTPGINGAIMRPVAPGQPIVNTINVDDIDKKLQQVEELGGKLVKPKWLVPEVGWLAFFSDPDGNMHGIMQPIESSKK